MGSGLKEKGLLKRVRPGQGLSLGGGVVNPKKVTVKKWGGIIKWIKDNNYLTDNLENNKNWVFRGEKDKSGDKEKNGTALLMSSLDEYFKFYSEKTHKKVLNYKERLNIENGLIRKFQRQSSLYVQPIPEKDNILEWLSLMRHHDVPTRFLDWTHSIFMAIYFAIHDNKKDEECIVWALDANWIVRLFKKTVGNAVGRKLDNNRNVESKGIFKSIFQQYRRKEFVVPIKPYKMNERLVIQQSVFLCPGNIQKTFYQNLLGMLEPENAAVVADHFHKITFPKTKGPAKREEIQRLLWRMNVNQSTLFPGLDGFARSVSELAKIYPEVIRGWKQKEEKGKR